MEWREYGRALKDLLGLRGSPVAVTYSMVPVPEDETGRAWACQALLGARDGKTFYLTRQTSACVGGSWHLGLVPKPTGEAAKPLKKFLVHGEKLFCSLSALYRAMALTTPPPLDLGDTIILSPLEEAEEKPDLVVFVCNPEQGCRLLTLAQYSTGVPPRTEVVGSTCHMAIAYPIASGEINVSLLDYTSRRIQPFEKDELTVSVPYHLMRSLVESIPSCTAGTAKIEGLQELMDETSSG